MEFSKEALANHHFQVHTLKARMPDGTLVALGTGDEPDRLELKSTFAALQGEGVDLAEAFGREATVKVFLAVPKLQLGRRQRRLRRSRPTIRATSNPSKLRKTKAAVAATNRSRCESLNARLLLSTQDLSGYDLLPIAQLRRASEEQAVPRLDPDYIPPVISHHRLAAAGARHRPSDLRHHRPEDRSA